MPPISATQARIDVMVNGQKNLDRLANSYLAAERNAQRAQRAVQTWGITNTGFARGLGGIFSTVNNFSSRLAAHTNAVNAANKSTASWGGSVLKLTKSMVLFSVLLPLVKLPETAIKSFENFVNVGTEWEHNLRSINSLLALQGNEYTQYNNTMKATTVQYGLMNDEIGGAAKQIASTLGVLQRNTQGMTEAQRAQADMNDTLALTDKIAKLSRASFEDMNSVQEAAFTMLAAGKLDIGQADQAFDSLFRTVQVGRSTFDQFNKSAGQFIPLAEDWIQTADNAEGRFTRLTGVLNAFEAASMTLGSAKAATGLGQIFQALTRGSGAQQQIVMMTENMRRIKQLGQEYDITPQALYATDSTQDMFARIRNVMGPQGLMVTQYVNQLRNLGRLQDEAAARASRSHYLLTQYLGNVRAARAFEAIDPATLAQAATEHAAVPGEQGGYDQYTQDPQSAAQRASRAYDMIKTSVFDSMSRDFLSMNNGIATMFDNIRKNIEGGAGGTTIFTKLAYIGGQVVESFTRWYNGPGKRQITTLGHDLGTFIADAVTAFFTGHEGQNAIADAGLSFSRAFAGAVAENLPRMLGAALSSGVGQAVATYMLLRQGGAPGAIAGAGAIGGTMALQGAGGLPGQLIGAGVLGFGALTAGKVLWNRPLRYAGTGVNRMGVAGSSPAEMFGAMRGQSVTRSARSSYNGADYATGAELRAQGINRIRPGGNVGPWQFISPTDLYYTGAHAGGGVGITRALPRGDAAIPDIVQSRGLIARARSMGGRAMQIGGGLATAGVLGGLGVMNALQSAPGERSIAMGSAIGGTAGSLLGGLLGAIPAVASAGLGTPLMIAGGVGGGILGSKLGEMAGGAMAPWLEPLLGGGQAGTAQQSLEAQDTLVQAIDQSQQARDIEQINRKMTTGTGFGGGFTATSAGGATVAGTGRGGTFVNQYDPSSPLTKAQADAACGPAAASFFVSAYGRPPTLAEAYNLQNQIQGNGQAGFDIANNGGSNINALGQAINQMAGANVATVGNGVDWGIVSKNAQAGIPGIVNIGPNSTTGFPGHYFQIGGYNPATGQYNVGSSGSALRGGGPLMTQRQMEAYGPAQGAIYGIGAAGTTSASPTLADTEAYIRQSARARNIDPDVAVRAWKGEGSVIGAGQSNFYNNGVREPSFGPYQLHDQGWGAAAGFNTHDPANWKQNVDYALGRVAAGGWDPNGAGLHGATAAGITNWQGIVRSVGSGTGPGGGGGITINGPLIGTVMLGAGSTEDQANELATILADLLDESHITAGSTIGQTRLLTP